MKLSNTNNACAGDAAADDDQQGGRYTAYIDSAKHGPNTPVRRSRRNLNLYNLKSPTPNKTYRTIGTLNDVATNTDAAHRPATTVATVGTSTADADDDEDDEDTFEDDLCTIFAAKVRVNDDDLSITTSIVDSPMPKRSAGRYTDLVETRQKKKGASSSASVGFAFSPVRRSARNA